ncbi:MAG: hypothetical protein ACI9TY_001569 [Alphaproteobacteria bacterium]|jgi:hypothetical protein
MSSVPANFKKGSDTPESFKKKVQHKNKILGTVLGVIVLILMFLAIFLKG